MKTRRGRISATVATAAGMLVLATGFTAGSAQAAPAGPHTVQLQQQSGRLGHDTVQLSTTVQLGPQTVQLSTTVQLGPQTVQLTRTVQLYRQMVNPGLTTVQLKQHTVQLGRQPVQPATVQLRSGTVQL